MDIKKENLLTGAMAIPLRVLIVDSGSPSALLLLKSLGSAKSVMHAAHSQSLDEARNRLRTEEINTVFIDLLSFGIEKAAAFVFETRTALPEIVFVLFQDQERVEQNREEFFHGERRRFSHFYRFDKRTPVDSFDDELAATIRLCQNYLSWRMSRESLRKLFERASNEKQASPDGHLPPAGDLIETMKRLDTRQEQYVENTVFVSHRFSDADEDFVQGLTRHLRDKSFKVITGKLATGYISQAVISRIKDAEFFLCLLTRAEQKADGMYTASAWLHQELGAAIAFSKPVVLMVEEGVTDFGGLQGDVQRIHFAARGFMNAAFDAVEILRAYAGREAS